jgi:hypothetical protein
METPAGQPDKPIRFSSGNRAGVRAIYRLLGNDGLDREGTLRACRRAAIKRIIQTGEPVSAIQDSTSLNCNTQTKTEGIGYISGKTLGANIHSRLAVSTGGLTLGVLSRPPYNRPQANGKTRAHDSKKVRALAEKESYRRVKTLGGSARPA